LAALAGEAKLSAGGVEAIKSVDENRDGFKQASYKP
jgi:hypothetical protein